MIALFCLCPALFVSPFKSKSRLEAENVALRHQLIILRRKVRGRIRLTHGDRLFFVQLYRWFPSVLKVITIVRPETLMRWHRAGFRRYWRWKSRSLGGRPQIDADLRALIRRMSVDNPLWGAPRIHGELLKLGFEVAQSSVAKYMVKRCGPPSPGWRAFLRNHAPDIAAMDLFVAPTCDHSCQPEYPAEPRCVRSVPRHKAGQPQHPASRSTSPLPFHEPSHQDDPGSAPHQSGSPAPSDSRHSSVAPSF